MQTEIACNLCINLHICNFLFFVFRFPTLQTKSQNKKALTIQMNKNDVLKYLFFCFLRHQQISILKLSNFICHMSIILTLIARVRDGLILATSIEGADDPEHNTVKYMTQAKMLFKKLNSPGTLQAQSVATGQYFFHYIVKGVVCALCLCDQNFPRKAAFSYLEEVGNEFLNQHGTQIEATSRPYHFLEFDSYIQNIKRKHLDKGRNAMAAVNNELQDVTRIMVSNIEDVIHRGEALNILESRASDLSDVSKKYREDARQLNRRTTLFKLFIGAAIAFVLFMIFRFVFL